MEMESYEDYITKIRQEEFDNFTNSMQIKSYIDTYNNSKNNSIGTLEERIKYHKKQQQIKQKKLKRKLIAITLAGTIAISSGITTIINKKTANKNPTTSISRETTIKTSPIDSIIIGFKTNDLIDDKINDYIKLMNSEATDNNKIETYLGRQNGEAIVDYTKTNIENLANQIIKASKTSQTEMRCTVLAAYKIINEPYREEVLNKAFKRVQEILRDNPDEPYTISSYSWESYLKSLGYENTTEYNNNERKEIKNTAKIELTEIKGEKKI